MSRWRRVDLTPWTATARSWRPRCGHSALASFHRLCSTLHLFTASSVHQNGNRLDPRKRND